MSVYDGYNRAGVEVVWPVEEVPPSGSGIPVANPTGETLLVTTPDPQTGTHTRTAVLFPAVQGGLAFGLAGAAYPCLLIDSLGTLWWGDGTYEPFGSENSISGTEDAGVLTIGNGGPVTILGAGGGMRVNVDNSGNPNGVVTASFAGDICAEVGTTNGAPGLWQAGAAGDSHWVEVGTDAISFIPRASVGKIGYPNRYWLSAPTGSLYVSNGPQTTMNGESELVMDGDGASLYYGLTCSCVIPAGTTLANAVVVEQDTIVTVARSGTSEGSASPFSSGSVVATSFPWGKPPATPATPVLVHAPASASFDLRGTGVALLANGYLVATVVNFATTVPGGPLVAQVGGVTLVYSPDGGLTWSTTGTGTDQPNYAGTLWSQSDASASAVKDLGYGTAYAALGQTATVGVALQPAHGYNTGDTFESVGYFIGTYGAGAHIAWSDTLVIVGLGATLGFSAVEIQLITFTTTNWVAAIRNNGTSTLYQAKSGNAGTTWGTVTEVSTAEYGVNNVYTAPRMLLTSSGITLMGVSRISPNGTLAGKGLYQAFLWSTDAATTSGATLPTWHGPVTIDETGNQNTGDYGAITESPSFPGLLYMVYAIPNLATGYSNLLGRFMAIAFSGQDFAGGFWGRGFHSEGGDIGVTDGIFWSSLAGVRNKFGMFRGSIPPTSGLGGMNTGDRVWNNAGGLIDGWVADRTSGSLIWHTQLLSGANTTVNAPGATPTINTAITSIATFTGLATAITSMSTNLSGTPADGQLLTIRFTDNGTLRAITWGASFESSTVVLPAATVASTLLTVQCQYNGVTSKWRCILVA